MDKLVLIKKYFYFLKFLMLKIKTFYKMNFYKFFIFLLYKVYIKFKIKLLIIISYIKIGNL